MRSESGAGETVLRLSSVSKRFGPLPAVDAVSLGVGRGEVFTLLGPSGCGKTTTLRLVGGLEHPDDGEITLRGRVVAAPARRLFVAPHKRNLGMVAQSYAIWPHMTVFETVAYPLTVRGLKAAVIRERVARVLETVGLTGLEARAATLLSGGQMQRLALCRALVYEPDLLLLDEPFSNLDAKLREQMRVELKLLQRRLGVTILFVTHDQVEALSLSDRIAVMHQGRVEQVGSPRALYERPASTFVRDFLGQTVTLRGRVLASIPGAPGAGPTITVAMNGALSGRTLRGRAAGETPPRVGAEAQIAVRPEDIEVASDVRPSPTENVLAGVIEALLFVGERYEARLTMGGGISLLLLLPRGGDWREGQPVRLTFPPDAVSVWPV